MIWANMMKPFKPMIRPSRSILNTQKHGYNKGIALKALGQTAETDAAFAKAKELEYTGGSYLL